MKSNVYNVVGMIRTIADGWHEDNDIDSDDAMHAIYSILTEEGLL
tara:strand:- start:366 stop:500 length:135 start_codon:yes stop_codon:yes gene_type:complete